MFFNNKYFKYFAPDDGASESKDNDVNLNAEDSNVDSLDEQLDAIDKDVMYDKNHGDEIDPEDLDKPPEPPAEKSEDKVDIDDNLDKDEKEEDVKTKVDKDDLLPPETPSEEKPEDKVKEPDKEEVKDEVLVTEDLIKTVTFSDDPEKDAELRKNFSEQHLGKPIANAFKELAHARSLIGKKAEEIKPILKLPETKIDVPLVDPKQSAEEIQTAKEDLIFNELVKDFPELPKDKEEQKKWLNDLNYDDRRQADKFLESERTILKEVDQVIEFTDKLSRNYNQINADVTKNEVKRIESYLQEKTGYSAKELGYDFSIDENGDNALIDSLIASKDNPENFDPAVVQKYRGIPLIKEKALAIKFIENESANIFGKVKAFVRNEAISVKDEKKIAPSLSTQVSQGKEKKELKTDQVSHITDVDQIDKLLDAEDNQYFG